MSRIVIENLNRLEIEYEDKSELILNALLRKTDWMHACGGKGRCTTCKMIVVEGLEFVSEETGPEKKFRKLGRLNNNERLTCQTRLTGDILIRVARAYQMPHLTYSD